ncbi:nitrile hydratase subunit alpha [Paraburkholderia oxyphila]|uniref:nitrile hydratase subunit alpha n=1 Tax=Paraburkholderia oxyphila TaxID=614212 RepID=UPI000ADFBD9D|nr:nitrile hydratase subunit alpha [Paraburkholderia oxyphila]
METRVAALETLLKDKGVLADDSVATYAHRTSEEWLPINGARLCARAWRDPEFKQFLLADGKAAAASMGFAMPEHHRKLAVKENTPSVHNVICCTLCSCTAFTIIGMAPGWYKDFEYRASIVREARTVLAEMGLVLRDEIKIRVWDTTTDTRYMILPLQPPYTAGWSEERLARLVTKESLIGVQRLEPPFLPVQNPDALQGQ